MRSVLTCTLCILLLYCPMATWGAPPSNSKTNNTVLPPLTTGLTDSDICLIPVGRMNLIEENLAGQRYSPPMGPHPPSAEQTGDETFPGIVTDEMETYQASTLCSGLWPLSTDEGCFLPCPQPGAQPDQNEPVPIGSRSPHDAGSDEVLLLDEHIVLNEEASLTLADYSRLMSAYVEDTGWQDFLDSGRHATTKMAAVSTGWDGLKLDTVIPADEWTPFPDLTHAALNTLTQLSPTVSRLHEQLREGKDPLADKAALTGLFKETDLASGESFTVGNHSLVIQWQKGPEYVLKIARSQQDALRLERENKLYNWILEPENILLNLTTTPMRAAFNLQGKPILALRQVDGTARDRLRLMKNHSLNERLDFALSVIMHFCQMYRRFLEKDVLLADRHEDNIGFNEIPLQGIKTMGLDNGILQVPVMLDLDPYWFGNQEFGMMQLHLPTWIPVVVGLLEEVFTPVNSHSPTSENWVSVIDNIRQLALPVFLSSSLSSAFPVAEEGDIETTLQSCINHWFANTDLQYSELLAEARPHIERLLTNLNQWDSTPGTVAEWNIRLQKNIGEVLQWLNNWKNETKFSLLNDFTDEGIIRVPSAQRGTFPQGQQLLTLLSMIHGKLGCQKCSRTFTTITGLRKHWELHQQEKLQHCEICGGDFAQITQHKCVHTGAKPYECEHCSKCFSRSNNLQAHLRTHSGDKPYKCEHCGKCFSQNSSLRGHLRTHSGDKPYKCEHCGKSFSTSSHRQRHLLTHSGDKPYKCERCDKCFSDNGHLKRHLLTHSGDKPHKCEYCGKGFSQNSSLQGHLRTHSGDKPYKCVQCGKCFSQNSSLQGHLRTHSGDKPYKCVQCGKGFSQNSNLQGHLRTHSGDKPYKCELCGKCFSKNSHRKRHQRSQHG